MSRATRNALSVPMSCAATVLALASLAACGTGGTTAKDDDTSGGASQVNVTMVAGSGGDECKIDRTSAPAGPVTFTVKNESATGITEFEVLSGERIVGEKENVVTGLAPVRLTVSLGGGDYSLYCPSAVEEKQDFQVTGQASSAPSGSAAGLLQQGASQYGGYVTTQLHGMVTAVKALQQAVDSGNVAAAQRAYAEARPFYEKIETDIENFVLPGGSPTDNKDNLDYLIDMRASSLDPQVGWSGFHAVERDVFGRNRITAQTKQYAAGLVKDVGILASLAGKLTFKPEELANGAAGLLEEVQANKISGEEESFSHLDLADFADNIEGAQQAFLALQPGLKQLDPSLVKVVQARFAAVHQLLKGYEDPHQLGGYVRWTPQLRAKDAQHVSQTVQALADALSGLAEKVATA